MRIVWKQQYLIDGGIIDQDHRSLFDIINSVMEIDESRFVIQNLKEPLAKLKMYTIEHFNREEILQQKISYPEYESHKITHSEMIADLDKIIYDFRQRTVSTNFSYADLRKRSFLLLQGWIVGHILKTDAKMIPYIAAARDAGLINDQSAALSAISGTSPSATVLSG